LNSFSKLLASYSGWPCRNVERAFYDTDGIDALNALNREEMSV